MKTATINHKKYTVERVFNMVLNWEFTDKNGVIHLVDGEDVTEFVSGDYCEYKFDGTDTDGSKWYRCIVHDELEPSQDAPCASYVETPMITIDHAIEYAKYYANETEDGVFWWKIK